MSLKSTLYLMPLDVALAAPEPTLYILRSLDWYFNHWLKDNHEKQKILCEFSIII